MTNRPIQLSGLLSVGSAPVGSFVRAASRLRRYSESFAELFAKLGAPSYDIAMPARAIGSATISFGLVTIPVKLYTAASPEGISFNLLHKKCGGRLKQQYICPTDAGEIVERSEMVKGYEFAKNQYVLFSEEELQALESPKTDSLEILEFVPLESVDFIYVAKTYYLGPDRGGDKAYRLLSDSMTRTERVAVGRHFTRGKEQLALVRPYHDGLLLHYVYYANEVRAFDEVDRGATFTFNPVESDLADKLIGQLTTDGFHAEKYSDAYVDRVKVAIDQKAAGQAITRPVEQPSAQIIDLFEALKRSLDEVKVPAGAPSAANGDGEQQPKPPKKAGTRRSAKTDKAAGE
jgi:DNA end-binding protein Ku